ncbi:hypothetical protein L208DRAFT_1409841, partial [Tricholoma matsutake]
MSLFILSHLKWLPRSCHPPTPEWLNKKAKLLTARADHIHSALVWLKAHNPFHVQHILPSNTQDMLQSRYDENAGAPTVSEKMEASYDSQQMEEDH